MDDPGTQEAVHKAEKSLWVRFAKWFGGSIVVGLVVWASNIDSLVLLAIAAFFVGVLALTLHCQSVYWLKRTKRVLRAYPWEHRPEVKKQLFSAAPRGVLANIGAGNGKWSPNLLARNLRTISRWDKGLEQGAWFAGDIPFGGVLFRPGGNEFTFVLPHNMGELAGEREAADGLRKSRAREAKLGTQIM